MSTLIKNHISSETVKFIVGTRSIDEIDEFQDELKGLGVEEYIELYRNSYKDYMDSIFNK